MASSQLYHLFKGLCFAKLLQLCPSLCNPMDCSPPGFSVQGSLQTRILDWVAVSSSRALKVYQIQTQSYSKVLGLVLQPVNLEVM